MKKTILQSLTKRSFSLLLYSLTKRSFSLLLLISDEEIVKQIKHGVDALLLLLL